MIKTKKAAEVKQTFEVVVTRAHAFENGGISFDAIVNGVKLYNLTIKQGNKDGRDWSMTGFPAKQGSDGKWHNYSWFPISKELQAEIERQVESLL